MYQPTTNVLAFSTNGNQRMIIDASGNLILNNNLVVNGSTVSINTESVTVNDPIITLANNTTTDIYDRGVDFKWYDGSQIKTGFMGLKQSTNNFVLLSDASNNNNVYTGSTGGLQVKNLVCDVSTGIAPLTVTSSTLVTNLNSDYLDGLTSGQFMRSDVSTNCAGFIGIGTTQAINSLHVENNSNTSNTQITCKNTNASGRAGIELSSGGTSSFNIQSANGTGTLENLAGTINFYAKGGGSYTFHTTGLNTPRLIIANNGNVGIGTMNALARFHVTGGNLLLENLAPPGDNPHTYIKFKETGFNDVFGIGCDFSGSGDENKFMITSSDTNADPLSTDARLTILQSGNVGIGTNIPQAKLHVNGNVAVSGNSISIGTITISLDTEGIQLSQSGNTYKLIMQRSGTLASRPITARIGDEYEDTSNGDVYKYTRNGWYRYISTTSIGLTSLSPATTASQIYSYGGTTSGLYYITGTQGGSNVYNVYCDMSMYGGKWMLFAQLPKGTNFDNVSLYNNIVGTPSNLAASSYFIVPINILSNNSGYNVEIMVTLMGSAVGGVQTRLGAIFRGINLSQALYETTGDSGGSNVASSSPQYSNDGISWSSAASTYNTSAGWLFSISASSGTNSYLDGSSASSGWILHESTGNLLGSFYGTPVGYTNQGSNTNFDYARIWVRV
jgi:hypothetical protein